MCLSACGCVCVSVSCERAETLSALAFALARPQLSKN